MIFKTVLLAASLGFAANAYAGGVNCTLAGCMAICGSLQACECNPGDGYRCDPQISDVSVIFSTSTGDLNCQTQESDPIAETITLSLHHGLYHIAHYGHSRNTYAADYEIASRLTTRYGSVQLLKKTADESTWKDMPDSLSLEDHDIGYPYYVLSGLTNIGANVSAFFDSQTCSNFK